MTKSGIFTCTVCRTVKGNTHLCDAKNKVCKNCLNEEEFVTGHFTCEGCDTCYPNTAKHDIHDHLCRACGMVEERVSGKTATETAKGDKVWDRGSDLIEGSHLSTPTEMGQGQVAMNAKGQYAVLSQHYTHLGYSLSVKWVMDINQATVMPPLYLKEFKGNKAYRDVKVLLNAREERSVLLTTTMGT